MYMVIFLYISIPPKFAEVVHSVYWNAEAIQLIQLDDHTYSG